MTLSKSKINQFGDRLRECDYDDYDLKALQESEREAELVRRFKNLISRLQCKGAGE